MSAPRPLMLGDMEVICDGPPPRLVQALAVIATHLHPTLDVSPLASPGKSKESCILCSLVVRDFLFRGGFRDAELRPVVVVMQALDEDGGLIHSLGIGNPKGPSPKITGRWDGHAVVIAEGWLIDTTLYQAKRPAWPELPGMVAVPLVKPGRDLFGLPLLAGASAKGEDGSDIDMGWLDQPTNKKWRAAPDAQRVRQRRRVVDYLLDQFVLKEKAYA